MVKLSILLTRRADLTHEEFVAYWTKKHTPLIGSVPGGEVPVRRYVQLLPTGGEVTGFASAEYDGVAELWLDSISDAEAWFTSETYSTAIVADEKNFLDRSKTRFLFATEDPVFG